MDDRTHSRLIEQLAGAGIFMGREKRREKRRRSLKPPSHHGIGRETRGIRSAKHVSTLFAHGLNNGVSLSMRACSELAEEV